MRSVSVDMMCHGDLKQSSSSGNRNISHATCCLHREVERGTAGMVLHYHVGFLTAEWLSGVEVSLCTGKKDNSNTMIWNDRRSNTGRL